MTKNQTPAPDEATTAKKVKKRKRPILRPREAKFAEARLKGLSLRESAIVAGYSPFAEQGHRVEKRILARAPEVFNRAGVTLDRLAKKVNELLDAKKVQHFTSIVVDTKVEEDREIQSKAVNFGLKVHGALETDDAASAHPTGRHSVCVVVSDRREAAALAALFAPSGPAGVVIDVDAPVDEDLGREGHSDPVQATP